jgi:hypothetical protein
VRTPRPGGSVSSIARLLSTRGMAPEARPANGARWPRGHAARMGQEHEGVGPAASGSGAGWSSGSSSGS